MSRAFKQHMESADPRQVVAQVHQRRPTSVALRGSKLHMLSAVAEEADANSSAATSTFLAGVAQNKSDFLQKDMVTKFSRQWLDTQINLLVGVIARIGTQYVSGAPVKCMSRLFNSLRAFIFV